MAVGIIFWRLMFASFVLTLAPADTYGVSYDELIIMECTIKVEERSPSGGESFVTSYTCDGIEVFEEADSSKTSFKWSNSPFGLTHPKDACRGPVHPTVLENQTHIALVPTYRCGGRKHCSYNAKADNVGSSGYVAYITWNEEKCLKSSDLQVSDAVGNRSALAISVRQSDGWELMGYANSSNHVIDVNISLWKFGDLLLAFLGSFVGITAIICCCFCTCFGVRACVTRERYTTMSNRMLRRMTAKRKYHAGGSMNEACSICLEDFNEGEEVRELPCKHVYHQVCVDVWLKNYKDECPNCKTSITAKKKRTGQSSSEQAPLLAARDNDDEEAVVSYGSTRRGDGEEDTQASQARLTTNEPEGSGEESSHHLACLSASSEPSGAPTEQAL